MSRLTEKAVAWFWMILLTGGASWTLTGCSGQSLYRQDKSSAFTVSAKLDVPAGVTGEIPTIEALEFLRKQGVLKAWPSKNPSGSILDIPPKAKLWFLVNEIERQQSWIYDQEAERFVTATATHVVDSPDQAGRINTDWPLERDIRLVMSFRIRFVAYNGNLDLMQISAQGTYLEFGCSVPCGVTSTWSSSQERSIYSDIKSTQNNYALGQSRETVSSGVTYTGVGGYLIGGRARLCGSLQISSFVGSGVDRSTITIPIDNDMSRREWACLFVLRQIDGNARLAFKGLGLGRPGFGLDLTNNINLGVGSQNVAVLVCVE